MTDQTAPPDTGPAADAHGFAWGPEVGGLRLGIRASNLWPPEGMPVQLFAAVHNMSDRVATIGDTLVLLVQSQHATTEHAEGPRSSSPIALSPGQTQVLRAWQLHGSSALHIGRHVCWVVNRSADTAPALEVSSGTTTLEVTANGPR